MGGKNKSTATPDLGQIKMTVIVLWSHYSELDWLTGVLGDLHVGASPRQQAGEGGCWVVDHPGNNRLAYGMVVFSL